MAKIKESSTIQFNKQHVFKICPITYAMEKIGNYWKPIILFHLLAGEKRYGALKKEMPHITEKMLIQHLKQLENDELIVRKALPLVPPHVTYRLSAAGEALRPVLRAIGKWAIEDGRKRKEPLFQNFKDYPKG